MKNESNTTFKPIVRGAGPHPVDIYVGGRIRMRRTLLSLSQEKLADQLGVTFQQVQKYENGSNRVGASRLYHIAHILSVPVAYFYEGYAENDTLQHNGDDTLDIDKKLYTRETIELIKSYYAIPETARKKVLEMLKTIGNGGF